MGGVSGIAIHKGVTASRSASLSSSTLATSELSTRCLFSATAASLSFGHSSVQSWVSSQRLQIERFPELLLLDEREEVPEGEAFRSVLCLGVGKEPGGGYPLS